MTVEELVADLCKKFPKQADVIEAWIPQYRQRLQHAQGPKLAEAFMVCMTDWNVLWFPRVQDIVACLPSKLRIEDGYNYAKERREYDERVAAANQWWFENNTALDLFREYAFRCKVGIPTTEDLADLQVQADYDKRARERAMEPVAGPMKPVATVKANLVPMARGDPPTSPPGEEPTPVQSENDYGVQPQ